MYQSPAVRPLALHCIGFPLVSIGKFIIFSIFRVIKFQGYCVKRYIAYLMRIRKQSEVEANNKFYYQLLYEALPPENVSLYTKCVSLKLFIVHGTHI